MNKSTGIITVCIILTFAAHAFAQWVEKAKLTPSNPAQDDYFGFSVAIDNHHALIGALEWHGRPGYANLFKRKGQIWTESAEFTGTDPNGWESFGFSVSLSGNYCAIGAIDYYSGSAYIYQRHGKNWVQKAKLVPHDPDIFTDFGCSVSLDGNCCAVGAPSAYDSNTNSYGAVYIVVYDGTTWYEKAKLISSDPAPGDYFGSSVALQGDYCIAGDYHDRNPFHAGAAYIFKREGQTWIHQSKLMPSDPEIFDWFGISVSLSGDYALVGAPWHSGNHELSGAAYVFKREGSTWTEHAKLVADDGWWNDFFGISVSINGDYCIIGADQDRNGVGCGSAYIFERNGDVWTQTQKLIPSDAALGQHFGSAVAMTDKYILVGAPGDRQNGLDSGAAYVFTLLHPPADLSAELEQ